MKFVFPYIDNIFDSESDKINSIVIENGKLFYNTLVDISNQIEGEDGLCVLSSNEKTLDMSKYADITTTFVPFDIASKSITNKIISRFEKEALSEENYERTMQIMSLIEAYIDDLSTNILCDVRCDKLSISSLLKSSGIEIFDDSVNICEKYYNYMELVREFDCDKLFITVNMRSYSDDNTINRFMETVLSHKFNLLMIENKSYSILESENRYTIDFDLCEF